MEPSAFSIVWNYIINFIVPFFVFFVGIVIADRLKLYSELESSHLYLMSLPVALVTVGTLIGSATVTVEETTRYGYAESFEGYAVFCGLIMFYGTLTPEIFEIYRKKI